MTDRLFKVFAEPVRVLTDLVSEMMVRDELQYVLNQSAGEIEAELRREAERSESFTSEQAYNAEYPSIREAISSVDVTNLALDESVAQLIKAGKVASIRPVEGRNTRHLSESLNCLEFRIGDNPQDSLASLKRLSHKTYG